MMKNLTNKYYIILAIMNTKAISVNFKKFYKIPKNNEFIKNTIDLKSWDVQNFWNKVHYLQIITKDYSYMPNTYNEILDKIISISYIKYNQKEMNSLINNNINNIILNNKFIYNLKNNQEIENISINKKVENLLIHIFKNIIKNNGEKKGKIPILVNNLSKKLYPLLINIFRKNKNIKLIPSLSNLLKSTLNKDNNIINNSEIYSLSIELEQNSEIVLNLMDIDQYFRSENINKMVTKFNIVYNINNWFKIYNKNFENINILIPEMEKEILIKENYKNIYIYSYYNLIINLLIYKLLWENVNLKFIKNNYINPENLKTLTGLSFNIFKNSYINNNIKIRNLNDVKLESNLREGYFGGICQIFKNNFNSNNNKYLYHYDINSLYPYCMTMDLPINEYEYVENFNLNKDFGFVYAIVKPNIKYEHLFNYGLFSNYTHWNWYFSKELLNAKNNFNFEIFTKEGYKFKNYKSPFKDYIKDLYDLKINNSDNIITKNISKLLLNSFYGRFGINISDNNSVILNIHHQLDFIESNKIKFFIKEFYSNSLKKRKKEYIEELLKNQVKFLDNDYIKYIYVDEDLLKTEKNIAIASAISSYARIFMSKFIYNDNYKCYYTDTDSIIIDKPLNNHLVSETEIGKFKLVNIIKDLIIPKNKVYFLRNINDEIIKKWSGINEDFVKNNINENHYEDLLNNEKLSFEKANKILYQDNEIQYPYYKVLNYETKLEQIINYPNNNDE